MYDKQLPVEQFEAALSHLSQQYPPTMSALWNFMVQQLNQKKCAKALWKISVLIWFNFLTKKK